MKKVFEIFLALLSLAMIVLFLWGSDKGFDLSDEGLYILNLLYPEETAPYWKYGFIYKQLFGWMGLEVTGYRVLKLLLLLAVSYFLASEWHKQKWDPENGLSLVGYWSLFFLGSTACYAIGPPTLSYNDLSLIYSMAFLAMFLRFLRFKNSGNSSLAVYFCLFLSGLIIGFLLFTKFSAAVLVELCFIVLLLTVALGKNSNPFGLIKEFSSSVLGILAAVVYHFLNIGSPADYFNAFRDSLGVVPGHDSITLFKTYTSTLRSAFIGGFIYYLEIPVILVGLHFLSRKKWIISKFYYKLLLLLPVYLAIRFYISDFHLSGTSHSLTAFNPFFGGLLAVSTLFILERREVKFNTQKIAVGFFLLVLPFTLALGTNNPLPLQASIFQLFWILLFVLLLSELNSKLRVVSNLLLGLFVIVSISQSVHGYYFKPYRIPGTLADQNSKVEGIRKKANLNVHPTFNFFVSQLDSILQANCVLASPQPLISMFYDPGICYLLDGIGPGSPWYKYSYDNLNCFNVRNSKIEDFDKTVIISESGGMLREPFINCLNDLGLNFPQGYRMIGSTTHPLYGTKVFVMSPRPILFIYQ